MAARLIVNADDFGLTRGINRAIEELYQAGVLSSATLMANGPAFDDAVEVAHANPGLGVGCHVVLVDGLTVLPPATLPTLCPNGRALRPALHSFVRDLLSGRIDESEIEREALAQIHKLQSAGIAVTHLDTHKHTHVFPAVSRVLAAIMRRSPGMAIRRPFEPRSPVMYGNWRRRLQMHALRVFEPGFDRVVRGLCTTDGTYGISATGSLTGDTLREIFMHLPVDGTFEMACHPGYDDAELDGVTTRLRAHRDVEREALLGEVPRMLSLPSSPLLINYSGL